MWLSIACCTWFRGRLDTHDGSWFCQTRLWPRTRMPCALANDTTPSPGPKLYDPLDGSMVSHFISLPGVTMSNCWAARLVIVELLIMVPVTSVPKYRPCASAAAFSVLAAAEAGVATASAPAVTPAAIPTVTRRNLATVHLTVISRLQCSIDSGLVDFSAGKVPLLVGAAVAGP